GANKEVGLNHESGYLNKILNQITDSQSRLEKEINDINAKIENIVRASERKSLAREATAERLQEIEASIRQQDINSEKLEEMKKRIEVEFKSAESELNLCESRFSSLKALTENFEGYKIGVRTIMKANDLVPRQEGHIIGLVADIIQVDSRYEQAVEAVLADRLQYIIVESQEDGKQAVKYLKDKARGRGSFVPMNDLNTNGGNKKKHPQFPPLLDFVSMSERYKPLINTLLENTVVVKDLETALEAWRENKTGLCFVTIDGDIVDPRGVVSGGKLAKSSLGLLTRKREMAVLKEKSALYLKKTDDLKLKLEDINVEIQEKKESHETLIEDRWSCQEEINEFDKMLFRLGQELDQLEKLSQRISSDLDRKRIEQSNHKKELSRVEAALNQRKMKRQEEEEYFQKKEVELKESQEEFDQFRDELAKIKADYRISKEEQRSLTREMEMKADYADDSLKRLRKIEEDISMGHRRRDECQERREMLNGELGELYEKLKQAEDALTRADHEREVFHDGIKEEESKAEQLRGEMEALKDGINRSKMEHSEIRFKMNNLEEMAKEKFNLNLPNVCEQYMDKDFSATEVEERLESQKQLRQRLGEVNLTAIKEHEALKERYDFIRNQREDLINSIESLRIAIKKINRTSLEKFLKAFQDVDKKLKKIFPILFNGGTANLRLTDETRPLESGVLVEVQPPGKRLSHMGLLSGGEKALVGMAFIFAIYMIKPSPFCLLDEVDAPLDEANIDRFNRLLEEIKKASQIIMVTHSRRTMEIVDRLYGITMENAGISKTVSVDIHDIKRQATESPPNHHIIGH
ncbi:MAG: chromosome segregation protein SMC, partial [Desulfobacteraceae bacterium 4484_190.2]